VAGAGEDASVTNRRDHRRWLGIIVLGAGVLSACGQGEPVTQAPSPVERGGYLVTVSGCNDCHTPKVYTSAGPGLDSARLLSGHPASAAVPAIPRGALGPGAWAALTNEHFTAWAGPWGVSFAVNLTPSATGLESWTDSLFIAAMRTGKHLGNGRPILPPMPWQNFALFTDEDLRAIFAYLQSLPPVDNAVPAPQPPKVR
jgi:mono/diheme cytochrome c family protein